MITLHLADARGLAVAQAIVSRSHYLHTPVDVRCRPLAYFVDYEYASGVEAAAGPRTIGCLIFGRPEATRCYQGKLTYGNQKDVATGRAQYDRWEVLNLARVWLHPVVQVGGALCNPNSGLPGYTDRRGVWRSTVASTVIQAALERVNYDYLHRYPPCFLDNPYSIKVVLSYCDMSQHKGTIYRAAGFELARTNERGIETWFHTEVEALTTYQDDMIRKLSRQSQRSRQYRALRDTNAQQGRLL